MGNQDNLWFRFDRINLFCTDSFQKWRYPSRGRFDCHCHLPTGTHWLFVARHILCTARCWWLSWYRCRYRNYNSYKKTPLFHHCIYQWGNPNKTQLCWGRRIYLGMCVDVDEKLMWKQKDVEKTTATDSGSTQQLPMYIFTYLNHKHRIEQTRLWIQTRAFSFHPHQDQHHIENSGLGFVSLDTTRTGNLGRPNQLGICQPHKQHNWTNQVRMFCHWGMQHRL